MKSTAPGSRGGQFLLAGLAAAALCLSCGNGGTARQAGQAAAPGTGPAEGRLEIMNSISLQFAEYRGDPADLASRVDAFIAAAGEQPLEDDPAALVVPHAGYVYSGPVAAHAYGTIRGKSYDTVVVVGPSHRVPFRGISIMAGDRFQTPLGQIPMDTELAERLQGAHEEISSIPAAHAEEHSVEVQLPFLQRSLGGFSLVMAVVGQHSPGAEQTFVRELVREAAERRVLLVASSDLSHYHDYDTARRLDGRALDLIMSLDADALIAAAQGGQCELCGLLPVGLAIRFAQETGHGRPKLLAAASSGDTAGPRDRVVGYASLAFLPGTTDVPAAGGALTPAQRRRLLEIARQTIVEHVMEGRAPAVRETDPAFLEKCGAFVTIKIRGRLRGCVGNFTSTEPLYRTVMSMATAASSRDPRFAPMTPPELEEMELEISVLSPLRPVRDAAEIEVGKHGLYIVKGYRSGTLLPQVPVEYGWDRGTFLEQTCRKAGLPPDGWKEGAELFVYEAQVFGDSED